MQERKEHEEELEKERLFDYLYKTSTTSFEAKRAKHKKDYIPIPLEKRKPMFIQPSCCNNKQDTKVNPKHVSSNYSKKYSDTVDACDGEVYESCQSVCSESINPELMNAKSDLSLPTKSSKSKACKSSLCFIYLCFLHVEKKIKFQMFKMSCNTNKLH